MLARAGGASTETAYYSRLNPIASILWVNLSGFLSFADCNSLTPHMGYACNAVDCASEARSLQLAFDAPPICDKIQVRLGESRRAFAETYIISASSSSPMSKTTLRYFAFFVISISLLPQGSFFCPLPTC